MRHPKQSKISPTKIWIFLAVLCLLLPFQNCTLVNFDDHNSSRSKPTTSWGGDGSGYDGKLGTYYRVIPDFRCGTELALFGKVIVSPSGIESEILNPDCSTTRTTQAAQQIQFSPHWNLLALGEGIYSRSTNPPLLSQGSTAVTEAWCQTANRNKELIVEINYLNGQIQSTLVDSTGRNVRDLGLRQTSTQLEYSGPSFRLQIDQSAPANPMGELPAVLQFDNAQAESLFCRVGSLIDPQALASSVPLPTPKLSQNLLRFSESWNDPSWYQVSVTIAANSPLSTAPDGTFSAELMREDTSDFYHFAGQALNIPYTPGRTLTYSAFVKPAPNSFFTHKVQTDGFNYIYCSYDLTLGTTSFFNLGSSFPPSCSIQSFPNGWYRLIITGVPSTIQTTLNVETYTYKGGPLTYQGDGTSGALIWGAQLQYGTEATTYRPTGNTPAP